MSKNKRYKNKQNNRDSGTTSNSPRKQAQDSFQNPLARLGVGSNSLLEGTQYPIQRTTRDYNLMNSLYRNSWIAKKCTGWIVDDNHNYCLYSDGAMICNTTAYGYSFASNGVATKLS